jgi:arylsulfatase
MTAMPLRSLVRLLLPALVLLAGSPTVRAAAAAPAAPARPMNILVLLADDWRYDTLGIAGNPVVRTPNVDQLAREGVRFTNSCVTTAICGVSRASLFTGQWMSRHGNTAFAMFKTPMAETFPALLRAAGYHVGHVGKWHNGRFPAEAYDFGRSYMGTHWINQPDGTRIHVTQKNQDDALEFLQTRPQDQPFCLTVAFFAPHAEDANPLQYLPQPGSMDLYRDVTIPVPANATDESFRRLPPFIANEENEGRVRWHWRFDTPEKYQTMMKNYYRLVTEVDAVCGRVLATLREQGVLENTLVIFTGDNGYYHAEHGLADKWYPHQESIRVPMIIRDPRLPAARRGTTNAALALNVDLAETILAAAGVAPAPRMQGQDLSPLYLAAQPPVWRTEFFYEHATINNVRFIPSSEALVRREVKYILWPDFQREQLFDLVADPHEENDLINDPARARQLAELRTRFAELKAAAR